VRLLKGIRKAEYGLPQKISNRRNIGIIRRSEIVGKMNEVESKVRLPPLPKTADWVQ